MLAQGGEARIFNLSQESGLVAKIYHKPSPERAGKLRVMVANPPKDPMLEQGHASIAWPLELLVTPDRHRRVVGFLMPKVSNMRRAIDFFNPRTRRQVCPCFNYFYLLRTARNLVIAVRALHEKGYVVGDVNESNVLVSERALVTLVDTDSFQVWDGEKGVNYRCRVGKPEYTPPELQGKSFAQCDRLPEHDGFGLGVLLFQLLMEGTHPFAGSFLGQGEPPPLEKRIADGHFPYASLPETPYRPTPAAPPIDWLHPVLKHWFVRCFHDGYLNPKLRPDTHSWQIALEEAEHALTTCCVNEQHVYASHLADCPWCQRTRLLGGRDPFPSQEAVKKGEHLLPPPKRRTITGAVSKVPPRDPNMPVPRRIPNLWPGIRVRGQHRGSTVNIVFRWPQARNYWAGMGIFFSVLSLYFWWNLRPSNLALNGLIGLLAALFGAGGEIRSQSWDLDGRGQRLSRIAMVIGSLMFLRGLFS